MRPISTEKNDPLKRIQEEINEVAQRERELREKMQLKQTKSIENGSNLQKVTNTKTGTITSLNETDTSNLIIINKSDNNNQIINEKDINEDNPSDDSGISSSSSPVNGLSVSQKKYIRGNNYKITSIKNDNKILTRTMSTPQIFIPSKRFNIGPSHKGLMQRFIASRGKLMTKNINQQQIIGNINNNNKNNIKNNIKDITNCQTSIILQGAILTPPIIERDSFGRPIRKGFIPVEEKIQQELKDLKSRETELKKQRRFSTRQSQPDLLDSIEDREFESDDDSYEEHCFAPGKLKSSKSISELCDAMNSINNSPRTTPSPHFDGKPHQNFLRPAVSLAQLCDLDPEEAPSSHQLIAKWESLIQQNA